MPCFTGHSVNNQIIFGCHVLKPKSAGGQPVEFSATPVFKALLDTGAQTTCITKSVVDKLGSSPCGWSEMIGIGGVQECPQYLVDIIISVSEEVPPSAGAPAGEQQFVAFGRGFLDTKVSLLTGDHWGFDVLLGMDIILQCNFSIHSKGAFTICV